MCDRGYTYVTQYRIIAPFIGCWFWSVLEIKYEGVCGFVDTETNAQCAGFNHCIKLCMERRQVACTVNLCYINN